MVLNFDDITNLAEKIYPAIFVNNEIPIEVLCGQIFQESAGNTTAYRYDRNGGSSGLMQVDPGVSQSLGFGSVDLTDPETNVKIGFTYDLQFYRGLEDNYNILQLSDNKLKIAMSLVCYNCGPRNFNLMFENHLSGTNWTWEDAIKNYSLVSNWQSCLNYPELVFSKATRHFGWNGVIPQ